VKNTNSIVTLIFFVLNLIDTHSHIYLPDFDEDRDLIIQQAASNGISTILMPNVDSKSLPLMLNVEAKYTNCYSMIGLHPTYVKENYIDELAIIEQQLNQRSFVAVGEIGIDLYWDTTFKKAQMEVFEQQLLWAIDYSLPVVIHCRNAFPEVFEVVDKVHCEKLRGVFHSFSGDENDINKIVDYRTFKVGINGVVTFKKSHLPQLLQNISPNFVVAETDAPYLAPHPHRGKRNEPSYMALTVKKLAEIYQLDISDMADVLNRNSKEIFKF
jgi:TatD DNase family protein